MGYIIAIMMTVNVDDANYDDHNIGDAAPHVCGKVWWRS